MKCQQCNLHISLGKALLQTIDRARLGCDPNHTCPEVWDLPLPECVATPQESASSSLLIRVPYLFVFARLVRSLFRSILLSRYIRIASRLVLIGCAERSMVSPGACAPSPVAPIPANPGIISATNEISPAPRFIGSSSGIVPNPKLAFTWFKMPSKARLCAVGA